MLKFCVVLALLPVASKIAADLGLTVSFSLPEGSPAIGRPRLYVLPTIPTLSGVLLDNVADPPVIESSKSVTSSAPVASFLAYTFSLKVTDTDVLLGVKAPPVKKGRSLSVSLAVLLD